MGEYHALWQWFATMNSSLLNQNFFFLYILFYAEHLMACPERYGYDFQKKKLILPYTYMWRVYVKLLYKNIRNCGSDETILIEHLTPFFSFLIISSMSLNAHYLKMFVSGFIETSVSRFWRSWKWEKNTTRNTFCFTCFHVKNMKKVVVDGNS